MDESPNNAAARRQLPAQVVRRRADLPKRERPSIVKESVRPGIAPLPETETGSEQNASTSALAQASFDLTSFETDRFDDSVPISVWLSGEIEPVTE